MSHGEQDLCAFLSAFLSHFPLILWCTSNNTVRVSEVSSDFSVGNKDRKRRVQEVQLLGELDSDISTKHLKAAPNLPPSVSWDRRAWMPCALLSSFGSQWLKPWPHSPPLAPSPAYSCVQWWWTRQWVWRGSDVRPPYTCKSITHTNKIVPTRGSEHQRSC